MSEKHLPSLAPQTFQDALEFSQLLAKSDFVPKVFQNKPGDILAAIQMGYEIGLAPMAALQNIAVINGRPSIWGDAMLAVVQASGLLESIEETDDGNTATCRLKRKGDPVPSITTFSMADARVAGLSNKPGPWQQYPARMRKFRARGFGLRDKFADALKGLISREEAIDITPEVLPQSDDTGPEFTPPVAQASPAAAAVDEEEGGGSFGSGRPEDERTAQRVVGDMEKNAGDASASVGDRPLTEDEIEMLESMAKDKSPIAVLRVTNGGYKYVKYSQFEEVARAIQELRG